MQKYSVFCGVSIEENICGFLYIFIRYRKQLSSSSSLTVLLLLKKLHIYVLPLFQLCLIQFVFWES